MSLDQVDDLEAAEDLIGQLERVLRDVFNTSAVKRANGPGVEARIVAVDLLRSAITYCRPSCDMHGTPHLDPADGTVDSDCGCPCHTRA